MKNEKLKLEVEECKQLAEMHGMQCICEIKEHVPRKSKTIEELSNTDCFETKKLK